jgi:hypothetical protein
MVRAQPFRRSTRDFLDHHNFCDLLRRFRPSPSHHGLQQKPLPSHAIYERFYLPSHVFHWHVLSFCSIFQLMYNAPQVDHHPRRSVAAATYRVYLSAVFHSTASPSSSISLILAPSAPTGTFSCAPRHAKLPRTIILMSCRGSRGSNTTPIETRPGSGVSVLDHASSDAETAPFNVNPAPHANISPTVGRIFVVSPDVPGL